MQDERLRSSLGYALVRAFRVVNRNASRALSAFDLSAEQAHILLVLWLEGPMRVGELQRAVALSSGTLTGALDRMNEAGLVRRVQDPADRRVWLVEPGKVDPRWRRRVESTLLDFEEKSFAMLTAKERAELLRMLTKISEEGS